MNWQTAKPWVGTAARLILGVVFFWASLAKLHDPRKFVQTVRAYDATWEWLSKAIGYGMPVLELAIGILLILGVATRMAAAIATFLLVVFLVGLLQAAARGIKLSCGCFGGGGATAGSTSYILDVLRDLGLLVLGVYLVVWSLTQLSVDQFMARNDVVVVPSAKRMRSDVGRRKYEAQLAVIEAQSKSRSRYLNGSLALVVALMVIIGIGVQDNRAKISGTLTATNATVNGGVVYGKKAAATVDVYEDFGCPICLNFEKQVHTTLDNDVKANLAQLRVHPIAILDGNSKNQYSTRAANAAICASDITPDAFIDYHNLLYGEIAGKQVQPKEGTAGPSDLTLSDYGKTAKFSSANETVFQACVTSHEHSAFVAASTDAASKKGINATPTVFVNGKQVDATLAALKSAIAAADAKGPAPSPSPTPTPTPTPSPTPTSTAPATPTTSAAKTTAAKTPSGSKTS